jgi:F0F1-type ATP synthase membrane subunit c/vacuolar-type H+-ATPase subunit K
VNFIKNSTYLLAISKLDGGNYNIDSILKAIKTFTDWCLRVGIALAGVSLVIGFVMYAVADVDKKAHVKQRIIQTMFGIVGIILAISLVNLIISLF